MPRTKEMEIKRLEDYPEYVSELEKLKNLEAKLQEETDKLEESRIEYVESGYLGCKADQIEAQAEALIDGKDFEPKEKYDDHRMRFAETEPVLRKAIALQREKVAKTRTDVSADICKDLREPYASLVKATIEAATELQKTMRAEREFRTRLIRGGIAFSGHFPAVVLNGTGLEKPGKLAGFVNRAQTHGYI